VTGQAGGGLTAHRQPFSSARSRFHRDGGDLRARALADLGLTRFDECFYFEFKFNYFVVKSV
jgi:hypothetical protein